MRLKTSSVILRDILLAGNGRHAVAVKQSTRGMERGEHSFKTDGGIV